MSVTTSFAAGVAALSGLLIAMGTAAAQTAAPEPLPPMPEQRSLRFGVSGGVTMATVDSDDFDSSAIKNRQGFRVGGVVQSALGPSLVLQAEAAFVQKGFKVSTDFGGGTIAFDYAQATVLLFALIRVAPTMNVRAGGGGAVGAILSAKVKAAGNTEDIKDNVKSLDLGLAFGGGLDVRMANGGVLQLDLRYEHGLSNINDTSDESDAKNRVFSVTAGYLF